MPGTLAVLQPGYLPWLGLFEQIALSRYFVVLDDVQFDKGGWRNRNRILLNGQPFWLTIPVSAPFGTPLNRLALPSDQSWRRKHRATLRHAYAGLPGFAEVDEMVGRHLASSHGSLASFTTALILEVAGLLGLSTEIHLASSLAIGGQSWPRLLDMCRHFGVDTYLSGPAARFYLDEVAFNDAGVSVVWHEFVDVSYAQRSPIFVPRLSFVDAACSLGLRGLTPLIKGTCPRD